MDDSLGVLVAAFVLKFKASKIFGPVAQWLERQPFKLCVAGSIPAGLTQELIL